MSVRIRIGSRAVGDGEPCFIVAEAGSNHDGKLEQAKQLIDVARAAGADAVKFQNFRADHLYPRAPSSAEYLRSLGIEKPIYDLIRELEMPREWIPVLAAHCRERGIIFLSTPFDEGLADAIDPFVPAFKIASYELTHIPLLRHVARKGKPMLISTGGASLAEVTESVQAVRAEGNDQLCVMQCTAKYPAPLDAIDVRAMDTLRDTLGVLVGLSDHSTDPVCAPAAAAARGAAVIEKHFTLDRSLPGPDHSYAIEPSELARMIETIRGIERALGRPEKVVRPEESELSDYRRSIFTLRPVRGGERFSRENLAILRRTGTPDPGLAPRAFDDVLGLVAANDLEAWHPLAPSDVVWPEAPQSIASSTRSAAERTRR